jgi:hypothetical protein
MPELIPVPPVDELVKAYETGTISSLSRQFGASTGTVAKWLKEIGIHRPKVLEDLTGQRFGKWVVVGRCAVSYRTSPRRWLAKCVCGTERAFATSELKKAGPDSGCVCGKKTGYLDIPGRYWGSIVSRAEKSGREMTVTIEDAWELYRKQEGLCALSYLPIAFKPGMNRLGTASLDRIDSRKGYITGNVQWLHRTVNWMKNQFPQGVFMALCMRIGANAAFRDQIPDEGEIDFNAFLKVQRGEGRKARQARKSLAKLNDTSGLVPSKSFPPV